MPVVFKMPKHKLHGSDFIKTFQGGGQIWIYEQSTEKVICQICVTGFSYSAKNVSFRIKQYVKSDKHKKQLSLHAQRQSVISFETEVTNKFFEDLTHSLVAENIPFNKLQNESFKSFLEERTGKSTPDESAIRKNYLPKEFKKVLTRSKTM